MSESNVSRLSKVFFPQADIGSPLKGQNALLTGASYGIGAQIAAYLAAHGINIAVSARSTRSLAALAKELMDRYGVDRHGHPSGPHASVRPSAALPRGTTSVGQGGHPGQQRWHLPWRPA